MASSDPVVPPVIKRNYGDRLTLDLDSSLPATMPEGCLSLKNVIRRNGRGLAKRPGTKMVCVNEFELNFKEVYLTAQRYAYANTIEGTTEKLLCFVGSDTDIFALEAGEGEIQVNYTGAGTASMSILATAAGVWEVNLYVDGVAVSGWPKTYSDSINTIVGNSYIATLVAAIDALANWTASYSPALSQVRVAQIGSLPLTNLVPASTPDISIPFTYCLDSPTAASVSGITGFPTSYLERNIPSPDYLNYTNLLGVNINNCFYLPFSPGLPQLKYDGHYLCKPGLPRAKLSSIADTGSGTTHAAGNTYIYRIAFWRVDNKSNIIYGPYSDDALAVATHTVGGAPTNINVVINSLARESSSSSIYGRGAYYDPRTAKVNGNQASVTTLTVDAGHNVQVGDVLYFYNRLTSAYETRTITAKTATTITFAVAISMNDDDLMSNIRIQIQRTMNGGIDFFEVANIPNDGRTSATTQTYVDSIADTALGDAIEEQAKLPEPPPNGFFTCIHQGLLVYANLEGDPVGFCWNDPEWGVEAFPAATNRDQVLGRAGGAITAIISESDTSLAIFKEHSYFRIQGDLASGQYTITEVSDNRLGISSQASLVKLETGIYGISADGPVIIKDGTISLLSNSGVLDYFNGNRYTSPSTAGEAIPDADESKLVTKRSTGHYWPAENIILFFLPAEEGTPQSFSGLTGMNRFANSSSVWLCYDITTQEWREWDFFEPGVNAHLSMTLVNEELYFVSTQNYSNTVNLLPKNYVWKFLPGDSTYDFADNADPIEFAPRLQWESLGSPSSEKKMTEAKLYMRNSSDFLAAFDLTFREYRNNDDATLYTQASRSFSASSDKEKIIEPIPGDFVSNSVELYNNDLYECPVLSGIELVYKITSSPEVKDIKGDV